MQSRQARYRARKRQERKEKGLCRECGCKLDPVIIQRKTGRKPTGYRCEKCKEKERARAVRRKARQNEENPPQKS